MQGLDMLPPFSIALIISEETKKELYIFTGYRTKWNYIATVSELKS